MNIGNNVHIYSDIFSKEPYMISIDDGTTISGNVTLVTHDNSISKYYTNYTDIFGRISIGKNCFIGMGSMILPGVSLPDNTIVAAGSVVTKSVILSNELDGGVVIGGNPAKLIGTIREMKIKNERYGFNITGLSFDEKKTLLFENEERLIVR